MNRLKKKLLGNKSNALRILYDDVSSANCVLIALLVMIAVFLLFLSMQPLAKVAAAYTVDDGYYYLKVAQNIADGYGITYDRMTYTNGFHPLWELVCAALVLLSGLHSWDLLQLMLILQTIILMASFAAAWRLAGALRLCPVAAGVMVFLIYVPRFGIYHSLLESGLTQFAILLLLLVGCVVRLDCRQLRGLVTLGVMYAVVFLSRLDTIAIIICFLLAQLFAVVRAERYKISTALFRGPLISGSVFCLITLPYLVGNYIWNKSFIPVSGLKKSMVPYDGPRIFEHIVRRIQEMVGLPELAVIGIITLCVGVVLLSVCLPITRANHVNAEETSFHPVWSNLPIVAFGSGTLLRAIHLSFFIGEYNFVPWYWVPEYISAAILISVAVERYANTLRRPVVCIVSVILAITGFLCLLKEYRSPNALVTQAYIEFAEEVKARTCPSDRLVMWDSGVVSMLANRNILGMNGLIADKMTMELVVKGEKGRADLVRKHLIDYAILIVPCTEKLPNGLSVVFTQDLPKGHGYYGSRFVLVKWPLENEIGRSLIKWIR